MLHIVINSSNYFDPGTLVNYCDQRLPVCLLAYLSNSPLPLTDPSDEVPRAHRAVHRC